jgi:hypothetical protein
MPGCKKAFAIGASPWPYGGLRASLRLVVAGDPRRLARRPGRFISYNKESYFNQQGLDIQLPIEGLFTISDSTFPYMEMARTKKKP